MSLFKRPSPVWSPEHRALWERVRVLPRLVWPTRVSVASAFAAVAGPARGDALDWAAANPFDLDGPSFLWLYAALIIVAALVTWLLQDAARTSDRRPDLREIGDMGLAYLGGGTERAADTLYLALAAHGAASIENGRIAVTMAHPSLPAPLEAYRAALAGKHSRRSFKMQVETSRAFAEMLERLRGRRILLGPDRRRRVLSATIVPGTLLLVFGLVELCVDLARGKPLGFLVLMIVTVLVSMVVALRAERFLTREARDCLAALRQSRSRVLRAPTTEELPFAFAMLGAVALEGTVHADYGRLLRAGGGRGFG